MVDTLVSSLGLTTTLQRVADTAPPSWYQNRYFRSLLSDGYCNLSYVHDWHEAFRQADQLQVDSCNVNNYVEYRRSLRKVREYDLVILLHSAAGDSVAYLRGATGYFQDRRGQLLVFFGNEHNLIPDKIQFAQEVGADYIASQLPKAAAAWLYSGCTKSRILLAPAALNPQLYKPTTGSRHRDIGFRGDQYSYAVGDIERTEFLRHVANQAPDFGLVTDIQFVRHPRTQWIGFLNDCRGTVGAESGTYYLEKDDLTQRAVLDYLRDHPHAGFDDIYRSFFENHPKAISGKAVSSRHFEPIGTKTCQILLEGHYNGILRPNEHYICVKKDFSNFNDAITRFKDAAYRTQMVEQTYEYALSEHTYDHRVRSLLNAIKAS